MTGTWGGGRTPVCVWYVPGVCVVNRCGGGWGGSVTPEGGSMGDCLRPIRIWALPRSCSYGPGGGGEAGASCAGQAGRVIWHIEFLHPFMEVRGNGTPPCSGEQRNTTLPDRWYGPLSRTAPRTAWEVRANASQFCCRVARHGTGACQNFYL